MAERVLAPLTVKPLGAAAVTGLARRAGGDEPVQARQPPAVPTVPMAEGDEGFDPGAIMASLRPATPAARPVVRAATPAARTLTFGQLVESQRKPVQRQPAPQTVAPTGASLVSAILRRPQ